MCSEGYKLTPYLHFVAMLMRKNQINFEDNKYSKVDLNVLESSYFITVMAILGYMSTRLHLELTKTEASSVLVKGFLDWII